MTQSTSGKPDILVLKALMPAPMQELENAFTLHRYDQATDPDALLAAVGSRIRGVITSGVPGFPGDLLPRLPALEIVSTSSVGVDSIDVAACKARGVHVTNTPDVLNDDVADIAIGLLLNAFRRLGAGHEHVRTGAWSREGMMPLTRTLKGARMGILGLGRIGMEIARRAEAMKMVIGYTARSRKNVPYAYHDNVLDLARNSDVLVLACPGGSETRHLVNAAVLEALGPEGWVVNIARGSVIDEPALLDALERRTIGGAALDVYESEPHINPRFYQLDNAVFYPHHASGTLQTRNAMSQLALDNLKAYFFENRLLTPV